MRLGILIGSQKETGPHFSLRQQMLNVVRFKNGKLNCLIATAVAEEGLDIPDCNLIIRFDLYHTMIQYIQSRGRARHSESLFIHMVDSTNQDQLATLQDVKIAEATMKEFCQKLPEDRLIDKDEEEVCATKYTNIRYFEESTGATLSLTSSMQLISHYCGHLVCALKFGPSVVTFANRM